MVAVAALPGTTAHRAEAARASGQGIIMVSPAAGGPGTHLSLDIRITVDPLARYELRYTTTAADLGGCAAAQPMPVSGLNPFTLGTQAAAGTFSFIWPSTLGSDQYYFCVYPAPSSAQTPAATPAATPTPTSPSLYATDELAHSIAPFALTRDTSPQISVTLPGNATPASDGIPLGSPFTATISDWKSPQGTCPAHLWLLMPDNISRVELLFSVASPLNANRQCVLATSTTPSPDSATTLSPGQYTLLAGDSGIYQESAPLTFVPAAAPTTTSASPTVASTRSITSAGSSATGFSPLVYVLSALTLLIALGLVGVVGLLALRYRGDTRQAAMRQMGLDVEPMEPRESREPIAVRATARSSSGDDATWHDERDDYWQPPAERPATQPTPPSTRRW
jgi:hypothetical protein